MMRSRVRLPLTLCALSCGQSDARTQPAVPIAAVALEAPPTASNATTASPRRALAERDAAAEDTSASIQAARQAALKEAEEFGMIGLYQLPGADAGTGSGAGLVVQNRPSGSHSPNKAPRLVAGPVQLTGALPPEVVQRIVRQNFGRYRLCYENGLRTNPNLQGRITIKFTIGRSGDVVNPTDGGSDIGDPSVINCVARAFGNLSFPQPEKGDVTVVYPIMFSPGD